MATIEVRPGDVVNIVWKSVQDTPMGPREVDSIFPFTYDELVHTLGEQKKPGRSKASQTDGARFSRMVALAANALRKGHWSNGGDIDREVVFNNLVRRFYELEPQEYGNMTDHAKRLLSELYRQPTVVSPAQSVQLEQMLSLLN